MSTRSITTGPVTGPVTGPATGPVQTAPMAGSRPPRAQRRTPYRVPCRVRLIDPTTGRAWMTVGETVNISTGGMALQVAVDVPVGTWVETLVPHVSGDPLFLCGTVAHSRRTLALGFELGVTIAGDTSPGLA